MSIPMIITTDLTTETVTVAVWGESFCSFTVEGLADQDTGTIIQMAIEEYMAPGNDGGLFMVTLDGKPVGGVTVEDDEDDYYEDAGEYGDYQDEGFFIC